MRTEEEAGGPLEVAMLARVLLEVCDTLEKVDRLVRKRGKCVSGGCIYGVVGKIAKYCFATCTKSTKIFFTRVKVWE